MPGGLLLPMQRDVRRVGEPYNRMTVLQAEINPVTPVDSFAIGAQVRARYIETARRPKWDIARQRATRRRSLRILPPQTGMAGAIRIGGKRVLVETGQAAGVPPIRAAR